ncbi:MAG: hypothetical protein ACJA1B_002799 [Polaribacter sp.]|jgi:hypothetical protein
MKTISKKNIKNNSVKINQMALETTERVVLKSIHKVEELQKFTSKSIRKTLEFSEKQQEKIFNTLDKNKKVISKSLNKTLGFFSRN